MTLLDEIAERAASIVAERYGRSTASPWMTRAAAADYMSVPASRLEKAKKRVMSTNRGRVLYHRDELDALPVHTAKATGPRSQRHPRRCSSTKGPATQERPVTATGG